ncbi:MAG: DUF4082 domain-containing protein [Geobacteraceae bacterium]|nr:DUF4082 domain-containing protein [Geobacteraceae bacterium]
MVDSGPDSAVELGLKFRSDVSGTVTGIRFYKAVTNTGTHTGTLWSSSGTRLATATFSNETASGWQQVNFATPVVISANTIYVASYHTNSGHYSDDQNFFTVTGVDNAPLHALADGVSGVNGVYVYGSGNSYPSLGWRSSNYWVDVVFSVTPSSDTTPPTVTAFTVPAAASTLTVAITTLTATDDVGVTGYLVTESAATPSATASGWASAVPTSYTFTTTGTKILYAWARDAAGNVSAGVSDSVAITLSTTDPILIISSAANPFSSYYAEILRTEGFNAFDVGDIASLSSAQLAAYDVVVLGEMPLTTSQVTTLSNWVNAGGHLVAMRPDKKLAPLLGLSDLGSTISNAYLLINTQSGPGAGIVDQTIQYHGTADLYALNGAAMVAALYFTSTTGTSNPAVTLRTVGTSGGQAAAFAYDLARSVIYTRQGNPAWSGQERDGQVPIRSDDLYYGNASYDPEPDWVDLDKVAIPQADEQQRLLANLIIQMNIDKKPLPRFGYFPRNLPAVVVMTGDDHGIGGTAGRFDEYSSMSPPGCSVANWECIRSTSYIFASTPLSNAQASAYNNAGFEVGLHVTTDCLDWTPATLRSYYSTQLGAWRQKYTSVPSPVTHRTHCIVWSDYATQPAVELTNGMRLDTSYYYWPPGWVANVPGLFTGSGMPMRYADTSGTMIDVYQAATQMTDESGQSYPFTIDTLLDNAIGPDGYYGAFVANMHTDTAASAGSDAIVNSAQSRGIPIVSARQMLTWLDGRNASTFGALSWSGSNMTFTITAGQGANGLVALLPLASNQSVTRITNNGSSIPFSTAAIKGIRYARFAAATGTYLVAYSSSNDTTPPTVTAFAVPTAATTLTVPISSFTATDNVAVTGYLVNESATPPSVSAAGWSTTAPTSYRFATGGSKTLYAWAKDASGNVSAGRSGSITITISAQGPYTIWPATTIPAVVDSGPDSAVELGVRFRSDTNGTVTGIRFYKASTNTGTHSGSLWSSSGTRLATGTFGSETASGWQQLNFVTPVTISANTVYVASYHTNLGHYSFGKNFFAGTGVDSPPLHALADGASGGNGVFAYGPGSFPNQGWNSSNYWVDVVFQP